MPRTVGAEMGRTSGLVQDCAELGLPSDPCLRRVCYRSHLLTSSQLFAHWLRPGREASAIISHSLARKENQVPAGRCSHSPFLVSKSSL
jgi:hypothetical protein